MEIIRIIMYIALIIYIVAEMISNYRGRKILKGMQAEADELLIAYKKGIAKNKKYEQYLLNRIEENEE